MLPDTSSFFLLPVAGERDLVLCISAYLRMGTAGQMFFCVGAAEEEDEGGLSTLSLSLVLTAVSLSFPVTGDVWADEGRMGKR